MKKIFRSSILLGAALLLASCGVNPSTATRALEAQGFSEITIDGFAWIGCGREDTFASNFSAKGANGAVVTGQVCQGLFKGTTIRLD